MTLPLPLEQDLDAYAVWTAGIWMGEAPLDERDYTVMSLGLGGELGEVMEVLEASGATGRKLDRVWAAKEMGDVLYYWARIGDAFELPLTQVMQEALQRKRPTSLIPKGLDNLAHALAVDLRGMSEGELGFMRPGLALALGARVGSVLEILKKRVRDGHFDQTRFTQAMGEAGAAWCRLCVGMGLEPAAVAKANFNKIEDRKARGVMRGNGNER